MLESGLNSKLELHSNDLILGVLSNGVVPGHISILGRYEILTSKLLQCSKDCGVQGDQNVVIDHKSRDWKAFYNSRKNKVKDMCESCATMLDVGMRGCSRDMIKVRGE